MGYTIPQRYLKKNGASLSTDTPLPRIGNTKVELKFTNYFSLDQTKKFTLDTF